MSIKRHVLALAMLVLIPASSASVLAQTEESPPATIVNDEGGPTKITGSVVYTNGFFTAGVDEPLIILEDQAGFVDRDRRYVMSPESQVLGQITSDFFTSPFTYSIELPAIPAAELRDVDHDTESDTGVMVYAIAFWQNVWGDSYLEQRDLFGGGWSGAYASTRIDQNPSAQGELIGGTYLVYAPDDQQDFPSGFGADKKLFTDDDPLVQLPQGYTVVRMDAEPFTFDRSSQPVIDLIEGDGAEQEDFSNLSYSEAFKAMVDMFRRKYAYTELKHIDWDAKEAEFLPRFEQAEQDNDAYIFRNSLRDFIWSIPDGHIRAPYFIDELANATAGGLGISLVKLDDRRVIVNYLGENSPAALVGIQLKAEILAIDGKPIAKALSDTVPWSSPFSSDEARLLQQLRYVTRFPEGTEVTLKYKNPGSDTVNSSSMTVSTERDSFSFSSFNKGLTGFELPVEFRLLDSGYVYAKINSFDDSYRLTIQLWERMMQLLNQRSIPGLIIDMRQNAGGSGFLSDQMAAYFFNDALEVGNSAGYDETLGEFYYDPQMNSHFILPPVTMRYNGKVAVLVGPNCNSACEHFTYSMTLQNRAAVVGQYSTAGLGGGQTTFRMPDGMQLQYSIGRTIDAQGNIIIEGTGIAPTVKVPINEETVFAADDPVLDAAVEYFGTQ